MEMINTIAQTMVAFLAGIMVGGILQVRFRWLDKFVNIIS